METRNRHGVSSNMTVDTEAPVDLSRELLPKDAPLLTQAMEPFNFSDPPADPVEIAHILAQSLLKHEGLGLAAPQIGLPYRVFVIRSAPMLVCFNPRLVDVSDNEIYLEEGCLTFPDLVLKIKRPDAIRVRYTLPNGEVETKKFQGMTARIFQHELDHLDGILFTERATRFHLEQGRNQLKRHRRNKK